MDLEVTSTAKLWKGIHTVRGWEYIINKCISRSILVPLRGKKLGNAGKRQEETKAIVYWYYYPYLSLLFQPLRLEIRWSCKVFEGSNPSPSARISTNTKIFNKCPEITKSGVVVKVLFTLLIICFLEGVYYFINKLLFNRTFKQINLWEWIIVILIIPSIFAYLYYKQSNQVP